MNKNVYYLLWTYLGNYSEKPFEVQAENPEKAAEILYNIFSEDFRKNGTVYVFSSAPSLVIRKGVKEENKLDDEEGKIERRKIPGFDESTGISRRKI